MQPTIGRIVHYTLSDRDVELIDQRYPMADASGSRAPRNAVRVGQQLPAMVVAVWDGPEMVNLQVFLDGIGTHWACSVKEGEGPCTWAWPPRV